MEKFMERMILIDRYTWDANLGVIQIDPLKELLNDRELRKKLDNNRILHACIKVKIVVNATKFHIGRATASVLQSPNPKLPYQDGFLPEHMPTLALQMQLPHLFIDPSTSSAGEFCIPMMLRKEGYDLTDLAEEVVALVHIVPTTPLKLATSGVPRAGISVYASLEGVSLSVPTPEVLPTRFSEVQETSISARLEKVKNYASLLTDVPTIAPYARGTEIIASLGGKLASRMGFSKPPSMEASKGYHKTYGESFSSTHQQSTAVSLTYDPKCETTVDPRIAGVDVPDEMSFSHLVSQDCAIHRFTWASSAVDGSVIYSTAMNPTSVPEIDGSPPALRYVIPPVAHVAGVHKYWRGTVRIRLQLVTSQIASGRLRLLFGPQGFSSTVPYNVTKSVIWDIHETHDISFDLPWAVPQPYLRIPDFSHPGQMETGYDLATTNGMFQVRVENELVGPEGELPGAEVLVSMSIPDLEVWEPTLENITSFRVRQDLPVPNDQPFPQDQDATTGDVPLTDIQLAIRNSGSDDAPVTTAPPTPLPPGGAVFNRPWVTGPIDGTDLYTYPFGGGIDLTWAAYGDDASTESFLWSSNRPRDYTFLSYGASTTVNAQPVDTPRPAALAGRPAGFTLQTLRVTAPGGNNEVAFREYTPYLPMGSQLVSYDDTTLFGYPANTLGAGFDPPSSFDRRLYVRTGDNAFITSLPLFGPITDVQFLAFYANAPDPSPMSAIRMSGEEEENGAEEEPQDTVSLNAKRAPPRLHTLFYDDPVTSFRTMLKREVYTGNVYLASGRNFNARSNYPKFKFAADEVKSALPNLFSWVTAAYIGMRGGMRYTYVPLSGTARSMNVVRGNSQVVATVLDRIGHGETIAGAEVFPFDSVARVSVPYYLPTRYVRPITFQEDLLDEGLDACHALNVNSRDFGQIAIHSSTAEDFTVIYRRGMPPLYRET